MAEIDPPTQAFLPLPPFDPENAPVARGVRGQGPVMSIIWLVLWSPGASDGTQIAAAARARAAMPTARAGSSPWTHSFSAGTTTASLTMATPVAHQPLRPSHPAAAHHRRPTLAPVSRAPTRCRHRIGCMTPDDPWLAAVWPFVRDQLPPAPASVLEVGCGTLGGFVPVLLDGGHQAVGVDPEAPDGPNYQQIEFEQYERHQPVECVVASLSLLHVADLGEALDRLLALLAPGGVLVVVEWARERFDEATARWGFARLTPPTPGVEPSWLHKHQERWAASGQPWDGYLRAWAEEE